MSSAVEDFDLDDVEVQTGPNAFKVEKDKKYRVGFPLLKENGRIRIQKVEYYQYSPNDDEYYSFRKPEDAELCKQIEAKGAELRSHFVTALLVYRTNKDGKMLTPVDWEVQPVKLNGKKVSNLKEINAEWDLATIDVTISSSNPAFQEHTYTPLRDAIWRCSKDDEKQAKVLEKLSLDKPITEAVTEAAQECAKSMADAVAFERNAAWIRDKLGILTPEEQKAAETAGKVADFEELEEEDL
jgi:hypothetical protein